MTLALICAAAAVAGLGLLARGLSPGRPPLGVRVDALLASPDRADIRRSPAGRATGWAAQLGGPLAAMADPDSSRFAGLRADLAVMGDTVDAHVGRSLGCAGGGAALAVGFAVALWPAGIRLGPLAVLWAAVVLAAAGAAAPTLVVRSQAGERRTEMRAALAGVCDLAAVVLAGGDGIETALGAALGAGTGWSFAELRSFVAQARVVRQAPWAGIEALGRRYGIAEAVELGSALGLAGEEGARLRDALGAQAAGLRRRAAAGAEAAAGSATEAMSFPVAAVLLGFLLLIGYPAIVRL